MMTKAIANATIPRPDGRSVENYADGNTRDIMEQVLKVYRTSSHQLRAFAPSLRGTSMLQTCSNVWGFVKKNIRYKLDPEGVQWVKTPARTWSDKECDCKSYSVFLASCLEALGIKGAFRFVSYDKDPTPTHVYVVVLNQGKEIILDCVLGSFNQEAPYTHKQDYNMSRISTLSGIPKIHIGEGAKDPIDLLILQERLELEQEILNEKAQAAGKELPGAVNVIYNQWREDTGAALEATTGIAGIGSVRARQGWKMLRRTKRNFGANLSGMGVSEEDLRETARQNNKEKLDRIGHFYLYQFVNDPVAVNESPGNAQRKKLLQMRRLSYLWTYRGRFGDQEPMYTKAQALGIVRNGAMANLRDTPEQYLCNELQKLQIANYRERNAIRGGVIGVEPVSTAVILGQIAAAAAVVTAIMTTIGKIISAFRGSGEAEAEAAVASDKIDWNAFDPSNALIAAIGGQPTNQTMLEKYSEYISQAVAAGRNVVEVVKEVKAMVNGNPPAAVPPSGIYQNGGWATAPGNNYSGNDGGGTPSQDNTKWWVLGGVGAAGILALVLRKNGRR
ncbi:MAG: hypothetical protein EOP50_00515 [Sphingobacteriales bacterium]|nr:MAG: hypothetical protein EOP50_00515 [Sphingobacteriales bacterium]